jgi:tetratricopeptide (TPR) repeat protein
MISGRTFLRFAGAKVATKHLYLQMKRQTIFKLVSIVTLLLCLFTQIWASEAGDSATKKEPQTLVNEADKAYNLNQFDRAEPVYQNLLEKKRLTSPRILLKLATMEETRGNIPQTLYYLNLLYTLQPDESVRTRMESLARQYQLDGYDMDEWDFFRKLLRRFSVYLFGAFVFGIALLVFALLYRRYKGKPLRLLPLTIILMLVLASAALNLDVRYGKAIVITGKAAFMDDASAASSLLGMIPPGTRLTVIGESDAWMRVVYKDKQGFVNRNVVWYF